MCNDFTDIQCVNKDFMDYGYAMRNDFMDMQCVNQEFMNYGYAMCNDFKNYGYGIRKPSTLRHFFVLTDMESVNNAPYATDLRSSAPTHSTHV